MTELPPIRFDDSGVCGPGGLANSERDSLLQRLDLVRRELWQVDLPLFHSGAEIPKEKVPLDAGFFDLPERLLDAYLTDRRQSELYRILRTAQDLQSRADRVVVLGIGGSYMGSRAIIECCCDPWINDLPAGERGGRPRIYFAGNNVDNDATRGLLHLLKATNRLGDPQSRWAIIVVSKSGGTLETAVALRQFINAWIESFDRTQLGEFLIPITGETGKLAELATAIGCRERFPVPDGVGGRFSVLSAVGLLPAAVMGVDIVKLLEGAAQMNDQFRLAPPAQNTVLNYVAVNHLAETRLGCQTRVLSAWSNALESTGLWYDQLLAESLGKQELGALPLTVVNTRDLHSRAQQHQEGRRDKLINNLIVDHYRHDPLPVGKTGWNQDGLDDYSSKTLPELMSAALRGTNAAYQAAGRWTTDLHLPLANEASLGQLFQMLMLATVLEGRWLGINPYGQPGVEEYKRHMQKFLRQPHDKI